MFTSSSRAFFDTSSPFFLPGLLLPFYPPLREATVRPAEHLFGSLPTVASIRHRDAWTQFRKIRRDVLSTILKETFVHETRNRAADSHLSNNITDNVRLSLVVLSRIVVRHVDNDSLEKTVRGEPPNGFSDIIAVVVRTILRASKDEVGEGVARCLEAGRLTVLIGVGKKVLCSHDLNGIKRQVNTAGIVVFEADRCREPAGSLSHRLATHIARTAPGIAHQVIDVLI